MLVFALCGMPPPLSLRGSFPLQGGLPGVLVLLVPAVCLFLCVCLFCFLSCLCPCNRCLACTTARLQSPFIPEGLL